MNTAISEAKSAFTVQAPGFDAIEMANPVLPGWRRRVYRHVEKYLAPESKILELNAGTGIDAYHFAMNGNQVHATDASEGMLSEIKKKIIAMGIVGSLTCQLLPFDRLDEIKGSYHLVFSNFGGLNCLQDLSVVTKRLPNVLVPGGYVTWVVMPPICPWEWTWVLKGKFRMAFRRLKQEGTTAHLEGVRFMTYYHSLGAIQKALGPSFHRVAVEGLGSVSPPPAALDFVKRFPRFSGLLEAIDKKVCRVFPFNRCADHIITTFQYRP